MSVFMWCVCVCGCVCWCEFVMCVWVCEVCVFVFGVFVV